MINEDKINGSIEAAQTIQGALQNSQEITGQTISEEIEGSLQNTQDITGETHVEEIEGTVQTIQTLSGEVNNLTGTSDYTNLSNKPKINNVELSGNKTTNDLGLFSGDYNDLTNRPSLFSGDYDDLSNKPTLFSGNYNDLSNKPSIPSNTSDLTNDSGYITNNVTGNFNVSGLIKQANTNVIKDNSLTVGSTLESDPTNNFQTAIFGINNDGYKYKNIRSEFSGNTHLPQYASGMAFACGDTHGYIMNDVWNGNAYMGGGNANKLNWKKQVAFREDLTNLIYPVGSIYLSVNNVNPAVIFGGVWVAFGTGRTLVGIDTNQTEFNAVEKTGGSKTHTLSSNEMPSHTHTGTTEGAGSHSHNVGRDHDGASGTNRYTVHTTGVPGSDATSPTSTVANHTHTFTTNGTGGGQAHNNLQPYITCYMWKRTA